MTMTSSAFPMLRIALAILYTMLAWGNIFCTSAETTQDTTKEKSTSVDSPAASARGVRTSIDKPEDNTKMEPSARQQSLKTSPRSSASTRTKGALFRVKDVAPDDVLNLRAAPDHRSKLVVKVPPDTTGLVATGSEQRVGPTLWREVRYAGKTGWASGRFLQPAIERTKKGITPDSFSTLLCFGNEPFWRLDLGADGSARCSETCVAPAGLKITRYQRQHGGKLQTMDIVEPNGELFLNVTIEKTGNCSDEMSDDRHMYAIRARGKPGDLTGCCN